MRTTWTALLAFVTICFLVSGLGASDTKEVALKGEIMCAKCELQEAKKCQTVIKVKKDGKEITYFFKDKGSKEEYHEAVCGGGRKEGTVTGTVTQKNGKNWITPTKVEYVKK
jgi:hypothetical protein